MQTIGGMRGNKIFDLLTDDWAESARIPPWEYAQLSQPAETVNNRPIVVSHVCLLTIVHDVAARSQALQRR